MKGFRFAISFAFVSFALLLSAEGQIPSGIRVFVPYPFTIGDQQLPAGDYRVGVFYQSILQLVRTDGTACATAVTTATGGGSKPDWRPRLVFHCYAKHCFLSEVWTGDTTFGRQLYASSAEADYASRIRKDQTVAAATPLQ